MPTAHSHLFWDSLAATSSVVEALESRQMLAADLAVSLTSVTTAFDWLVPADRAAMVVTVRNDGDAPAIGTGTLSASAMKGLDDASPVALGAALINYNLAPGASKVYRIAGKVPTTFDPGQYAFGVRLSSEDANPLNNVAISESQTGLYYRFGTWIGDTARTTRSNLRLALNWASDGAPLSPGSAGSSLVTFSLTGGGQGEISSADGAMNIAVRGSSSASALSITSKGAMTFTGRLAVEGSLRSLRTSGITFNNAQMSISGALSSLSLAALSSTSISIGSGAATSLIATTLSGVSIVSASGFASIRAGSIASSVSESDDDGSSIRAAYIGALSINGDSNCDIFLSGNGAPGGAALARVAVRGAASGDWSIRGGAGAMTFGSTTDQFFATFAGTVTSVASGANLSGVLSALAFGRLTVRGDIFNATIAAGAFLGDDLDIGGEGEDADWTPGGTRYGVIGAIAITGGIISSSIYCSFAPDANGGGTWIPDQSGAILKVSPLTQVTESVVYARSLPASVRVGGVAVVPADFPDVFMSA